MCKPMPLLTSCVLMLLLGALTSCASSPPTYSGPLTPPTIACAEHAPFERLAAYPPGPALAGHESAAALAARHAPAADYARALAAAEHDLGSLTDYSSAQAGWAIQASGVAQRNALRRHATADCLDAYRARGVIQ